MGKSERQTKIQELEKALEAKVICFVTSDRPNIEPAASFMSRDCLKMLERHLPIGEQYDTLALFLVSHGGDVDVPWPLVNLLRAQCKKLQVAIPYHCHSAATQFAIGCDEIIAGPRATLSPTDPTMNFRTGPDESSPVMQVGVEDVNAFVEFVKNTLNKEFASHGHEALNKLMDRVKPEQLGSINRTYLRSKLLIAKMLGLTSKKYSKEERDKVESHLTTAYCAHAHFISRNEMIEDLALPVVPAEKLGIDSLMWSLYEDYAAEFNSREPYDMQRELHSATQNPTSVRLVGKYIESTSRTDKYVQTLTLQGAGLPNINFTIPVLNPPVDPAVFQQLIQHLMTELNNQLRPFLVAKKIASFGEWQTE
jgi:hypothetical protein